MSSEPSTPPPVTPSMRRWRSRVLAHRPISPTGYELTLSRDGLAFEAGQLLTIHGRNVYEDRNYSIASGEADEHLQILYRLIPQGQLTPQLAHLKPGDAVDVSAPCGEFRLRDITRPLVFVATGTGIAPCRSFVRTHPRLDLIVLHGVRTYADLFYRDEFANRPYHACVSGEDGVGFRGRVTDLAARLDFPANAHFYLCGANAMFYDLRDVLRARGFSLASVFTEAYYYQSDD